MNMMNLIANLQTPSQGTKMAGGLAGLLNASGQAMQNGQKLPNLNGQQTEQVSNFLNTLIAQAENGQISLPANVTIDSLRATLQNFSQNSVSARMAEGTQPAKNGQAQLSEPLLKQLVAIAEELQAQQTATQDTPPPELASAVMQTQQQPHNPALAQQGSDSHSIAGMNTDQATPQGQVAQNTPQSPLAEGQHTPPQTQGNETEASRTPHTHPSREMSSTPAMTTAQGDTPLSTSMIADTSGDQNTAGTPTTQTQTTTNTPVAQNTPHTHPSLSASQASQQQNAQAQGAKSPLQASADEIQQLQADADQRIAKSAEQAPSSNASNMTKKENGVLQALQQAAANPQQAERAQQALQTISQKISGTSTSTATLGAMLGGDGSGFDQGMGQGFQGGFQGYTPDGEFMSMNGQGDALRSIDGAKPQFTQYMNNAHGGRATPTPATQMISMQIQKGVSGNVNNMTLQLEPADLGRVDIQLKFGDDGSLKAHMFVEKPETLVMLQRDGQSLQNALQDAGLQLDENSLQFNLKQNGQEHANNTNDGNAQNSGGNANDNGTGNADTIEGEIAIDTNQQYITKTGVNLLI